MKKLKIVIGPLIGALFLFLTLRQIDFANCWNYIQHAKMALIAAAVVVYSAGFFVRSLRWRFIILPMKEIPRKKLFSYLILGFFMNNLLPLRLGEFVRAHLTGQKEGISRSGALATIVVERIFDGLAYVVLFFLTIPILPVPPWAKKTMMAGSFFFVGIFTVLVAVAKNPELAMKLCGYIPLPARFRDRLLSIFENFVSGLQALGHGPSLLKIFFLSLVVWLIEGSVYFVMGKSFGMQLGYFQGLLVMLLIGTGAILPTAPGYVGTVEFLGVSTLKWFSIDKNLAFGYIITLHVLQLVTIAFWGFRSLITEKISFSELIRIEKQEQI